MKQSFLVAVLAAVTGAAVPALPVLAAPAAAPANPAQLQAAAPVASSASLAPAPAGKASASRGGASAAGHRAGARAPLAPSALKAVEERTPIEDEPTHALSPGEMQVARAVHVGDMRCEQGAVVNVKPLRTEGFFLVSTGNMRFRMHPVESRTGAIRLEDPRRGAMWLQLGNKSMLMSQKLGRRLADECQSPEQVGVAAAMRENPPPGLLDPAPARPRE